MKAGPTGPRWWLHAEEGSSGVVEEQGEAGVRVTPAGDGSQPWSVQLNRPGTETRAGRRYSIAFRVRADRARSVAVGVSRNLPPWDNLGLYVVFDAGPSWRRIELPFDATGDCDSTRVHFDLGGSAVPLEVEAVVVRAVASSAASGPDSARA
jgi:hypothetical protein